MKKKTRFWLLLICFGTVGVAGAYFGGRYYAWPKYEEWRDGRLTQLATTMAAQGDYSNAVLVIRRLLSNNQTNAKAWRMAAELSEKRGSSEAIGYQTQYAQLVNTLESRLELVRLCLEFGAHSQGLEVVERIGADGAENADFHRMAADLYLQLGRKIPARLHLGEVTRLRPEDEQARFDLARLELTMGGERGDAGSRQRLHQLAENPEMRMAGLAALIQDAVTRKATDEALAHARALLEEPELTINAEVAILEGLWLGDRAAAEKRLEMLQARYEDDAAASYALLNFMQRQRHYTEARRWYEALPEETRGNTLVRVVMARIFMQLEDWRSLRQLTGSSLWTGREYLQHAYQAYEARLNGRRAEADDAWKLAAIKGGDSPRAALELINLTTEWRWDRERYDMIWRLFVLMPGNTSIQQQLFAWERRQGRTDNLNRIFARLVDFNPDDAIAKNNLAYTSLLLRENLGRAHALALEVYESDPQNPYFITTRALSLYRQNKPAEGLAVLQKLNGSALTQPERRLLQATLEVAAGKEEAAASTLEWLVDTQKLLPEERELLVSAREGVARWARLNNVRSELVAWLETEDAAEAQGWVEQLPLPLRPELSDDMQLTNQLFAKQDWANLGVQLRQQHWGDQEHLRLALYAHVLRHHEQREDRVPGVWRSALHSARDMRGAHQLEVLAREWDWKSERLEAADRLFGFQPGNRENLNELLAHYRAEGRTAELVRLLNIYASVHPDDAEPARALSYYQMLSGLDAASAFVRAKRLYDAAPDNADNRLLFAFALWKQGRSQEAWGLLEDVAALRQREGADEESMLPVDLLAAAILVDLERPEIAEQRLQLYDEQSAGLPEEETLARNLRRRLNEIPGDRTAAMR